MIKDLLPERGKKARISPIHKSPAENFSLIFIFLSFKFRW